MHQSKRATRRFAPQLVNLEPRVVLSHAPTAQVLRLSSLSGRVGGLIRDAVLGAYIGAGSEFVTLLKRQVRNPYAIVGQFQRGERTTFDTRGFAALTHTTLPTYTGGHPDAILPRVAGAVVLPSGKLSLAAVMRGPMDELNEGARYVWAFNTGRGATIQFDQYPQILADTIVRVDIGQDRQATLTIDDLVNGSSRTLDPALVKIVGATIRLRLSQNDFPAGSVPLRKAQFAFWVHQQPGGLETVPNFLPQRSIAVGALPRAR